MPNADTRDGFFDPTLTLMTDSYYIAIHEESIVSAVIHVVFEQNFVSFWNCRSVDLGF